jgi:hypothetical protein
MRILFIITLFVSLLITTVAIAGPSGYHVDKTYKIGGDGGWDYLTVDSKARRLHLARHARDGCRCRHGGCRG